MEVILGCSLEDQSKLADQMHSRCDSIFEAARLMYKKYKVRGDYAKMADSKMVAMASRLADLERKTKHMDELESRLITAEREIASLQRKLEAAECGGNNNASSPTGRAVVSAAGQGI